MVGASRDEIRRVGAEGTVPHPPLVAGQGRLQGEGLRLRVDLGLFDVNLPDLGRVVGAAGGELLDVWREEDAGYVFLVRGEVGDRKELCSIEGLDQLPDEDVALFYCKLALGQGEHDTDGTDIVVRSTQQRSIACNRNAGDGHVLLRDQLVRAVVLRQVPHAHASAAVARDDFPLIRVDHNIIRRASMIVAPLYRATPRLPDLDGPVLGARDHPFALAVKGDAGDVARVALES